MAVAPTVESAGLRSRPRVVLSHPHGNANVREAAFAFSEAGLLDSFWTGVAWNGSPTLNRWIPSRIRRQLERRAFDPQIRPYVRLHPWREAARLAATQLPFPRLHSHRWLSPNACHEDLDRRIARYLASARGRNVTTVYGYDHGAVESFRVAIRNGQRRIYDLPIGHWEAHEAIVLEERDRWPAWAELTPVLQIDRAEFSRKNEEIELADVIVAPSRFVERTLRQRFSSLPSLEVVPFGAPQAEPLTAAEIDQSASGVLRALYVGALDLRKGVPYLFEALRRSGAEVSQTIVGRARAPCAALESALARGRWFPSVPRSDVLRLMRESDVFVFPTLFEGMALVVLEAMSQGCVVITTENSGAEDLITNGETGFIVPVRSADAIAEILARLHADRNLLRQLRRQVQARAAEQTWQRYRSELRRIASNSYAG